MIIIKIIGAMLILISCSAFGMYCSNNIKQRYLQLIELKKAIIIVKSEIDFTFDVMENILGKAASQISGPVRLVLENISELIREKEISSIEEAFKLGLDSVETQLSEDDINVILNMAKSIGHFDLEGEKEMLQLNLLNIDRQLKEAEEFKNKNEKMYRSLGVCIGLMIVIFII